MLTNLKIVVVGDGAVAKTSLLHSFVHGFVEKDYIPTVFDNYSRLLIKDGEKFNLNLYDSAGQEDYASLRTLSYPMTDIVLICFSVISPTSFNNVRTVWLPEINHHLPNVRKVLVGTKTDLRTNPQILARLKELHLDPVTKEMGEALAREVGCPYIECSPLYNDNVQEVFDLALWEYQRPVVVKKKRCLLL